MSINPIHTMLSAVYRGDLCTITKLIDKYGLSYSKEWSEECKLLCTALDNEQTEVVKLLLSRGSEVNCKSKLLIDTPLHIAVRHHDVEMAVLLVQKHANVNAKGRVGDTPLHHAASGRNTEIVKLFLKNNGCIDAKNNFGATPLHYAAGAGCTEVIKCLLENGAFINGKDDSGATPLHYAVRGSNTNVLKFVLMNGNDFYSEVVEYLLKNGANVDAKDNFDDTPLHSAARKRNARIVEILLKTSAFVDPKSSDGATPLYLATVYEQEQIAEILLKNGADVNSSTKDGYTPLHYACRENIDKFVMLLLHHGANINATKKNKSTALHIAMEMRHEKIIKLLLEHEPSDINSRDENGKTVLHVAIENNDLTTIETICKFLCKFDTKNYRSCVRDALFMYHSDNETFVKIIMMLQTHGFRVHSEDANDAMLLHLAVKYGCLKIIKDLLMYGADVNTVHPYREGYTLLHNAAQKKQFEVVKILIKNGADVNAEARDDYEKFPISYAIGNRDVNMLKFFLSNGADTKNCHELLHSAVKKESREMVEIILKHYPDIDMNARDKAKCTTLHYAVQANIFYVGDDVLNNAADKCYLTTLFLSRGAEVNVRSIDGTTPLYAAVEGGHPTVVKILLRYNADVNCMTEYENKIPLHCAAKNGHVTICKMLLDKGARINTKGRDGRTALHVACDNLHANVVSTLLEYGAEIDSLDKNAASPLQIAAMYGSLKIVQFLLNDFPDVESQDKYGRTALYVALKWERPDVVEELLDYGSNVNATCKNGNTLLSYATFGADRRNTRHRRLPYFYGQRLQYDDGVVHDYSDDSVGYLSPDGYNFFDMLNDYPNSNTGFAEGTPQILKKHIVKIRALDQYISEENSIMVDFSGQYKAFDDDCKQEIEMMKNRKISDSNVSYHDFLTKDTRQLALYTRNESIVEALELGDYKTMFPLYSNMIRYNFKKAEKSERLLNRSLKSINFLSSLALPELVSQKLLSLLTDRDLDSLIKAGPIDSCSESRV